MNKFIIICILLISILFIVGIVFLIVCNIDNFDNDGNNSNNLDYFNGKNFYYEIDNVLTDEECDYIINISKNKLIDSKVMSVDSDGKYLDAKDVSRTSKQTWLNNNSHKNIIDKAKNLINKYIKNPVNSKQFEDIQVVRYKPTQEYKEHYDICHPYQAYHDQLKTCKEEFKRYNSVRYATILFYLNDGFNGGETYFPKLKKKIVPKKGKALIFFSCNYNKDTDKTGLCDVIKNSLHAGLPVIAGDKTDEKWIANIWIRAKDI